jgi:hypothetical protein
VFKSAQTSIIDLIGAEVSPDNFKTWEYLKHRNLLHLSSWWSKNLKSFFGCYSQKSSWSHLILRFLDRTQWQAHTPSRTPLNKWSVHCRGCHPPNTTNRDKQLCPQWDSNLQSQPSSIRTS